jgi:hypothetical protein
MNDGVTSSSPSGKKGVKAKSGAWTKTYDAGSTVGEVRSKLSEYGSVAEGAIAYSGTTPLTDDHVLQDGETIEFIRKTGEKG